MFILSEYVFTFEFCLAVIAIFDSIDWFRYGTSTFREKIRCYNGRIRDINLT